MTALRPRLMVAVSTLGLAVSGYLTWVHYSGSLALCVGVGGCETVQSSRYARVGPAPVALHGLLGLAARLALSAIRLRRGARTPWDLRVLLFGGALAGTLFAAYLTALELFVIGAVCPWCLVTALCLVLLLLLASTDLVGPTAR